jgi:hypothetical protein
MQTRTLRPGVLVSLKTTVRGGVDYRRIDLEPSRQTENGESVAKWETTRTIEDPGEYERAIVARSKARALIVGACVPSDFGLLCPDSRAADLEAAIVEADRIAADFNATAKTTRVGIWSITGRVEPDDARAQRAINAEVRDLIDAMERGIKTADVTAIRAAANEARKIGGMLTEETSGKISAAIEEARSAAREIVKRVEKDGEESAAVISGIKLEALESARFAFLDLDAPAAPAAPIAPVAHEIDLATEPVAFTPPVVPTQTAPLFEIN